MRTEVSTPQIDGKVYELLVLVLAGFLWLLAFPFVFLFVFCYKTRKIFISPPVLGSAAYIALPAVLLKVHHRPEPLYGPSEVNSRQFDGLGWLASLDLRKPCTKLHPQPPNSVP